MAKLEDLQPLHPDLMERAQRLQKEVKKNLGITIAFSEGYRSIEQQNALYAQGRTAPGQIVTNAPGTSYSSQHQWGIAVDFYLDMDVDGDGDKKDDAFNNSKQGFEKVGAYALSIGLGWGGSWKSLKDRPHIYLPQWGDTTTKLKSLYGNPRNFIETWDKSSIAAQELPMDTNPLTEAQNVHQEWVKNVQKVIGAKVDGIAGPETLSKTPTISRYKNNRNPCVRLVQERLNYIGCPVGTIDGIAGPLFEKGVKQYQTNIGFQHPDGELTSGNRTWKSLLTTI